MKLDFNELKELNLKGCWVAGGAILSQYINQSIADYDIYSNSNENLIHNFKELSENAKLVNYTDKSATFIRNGDIIIQLIFRTYQKPQEIFEDFDFTCCMSSYNLETEEEVQHKEFINSILTRELKINTNTRFPLSSLLRINKYLKKGFKISKSEKLKLILSLLEREPITSWDQLSQSIGGVYGSIFDKENVKEQKFSLETAINLINKNLLEININKEKKIDITPAIFEEIINNNIKGLYDINKYSNNIINDYYVLILKNNYILPISKDTIDFLKQDYPILKDQRVYSIKTVKTTKNSNVFESIHNKNFKYCYKLPKTYSKAPYLFSGPKFNKFYNSCKDSRTFRCSFLLSQIKQIKFNAFQTTHITLEQPLSKKDL